jgi:hypothetical protein
MEMKKTDRGQHEANPVYVALTRQEEESFLHKLD